MCSPSKKFKIDPIASTSGRSGPLVGFIHNVSPVKTSAKRKKYFKAVFQDVKGDYHNTTFFAAEKFSSVKQLAISKDPVIMSVYTTSEPDGTVCSDESYDIKCNWNTMIKVLPPTERPIDLVHANPPENLLTVSQVLESSAVGEHVSVNVKVVHVPKPQERVAFGRETKLQEVVCADATGVVKIPLWGDNVDAMKMDTSYRIYKGTVKEYFNEKSISLGAQSYYTECEDIGDVRHIDFDEESDIEVITGSFVSVIVLIVTVCRSCGQDFDVRDVPVKRIVACSNCNMKQKKESVKTSTSLKFDLDSSEATYTANNICVMRFLKSVDKMILASDSENLENFLLNMSEVSVKVSGTKADEILLCE